jgi:glucosylceramidase
VAGTAYHCYSGDPSAQTALHDAYPDKGIWFTECSGSHGPTDPPAKFFRDTLTFHARNVTIGTTRNWAKTAITWNIALDATGGPHNGGCDTCTGLLTLEADGTVSTNAEYYTIGHLSKFVRPGAVRIASTSFGTTGWNGQIMDVAFRNPDGSTALVVHNENDDPRTFAVAVGGRSFDYTLPGGALATFTWPRSRLLDDGYDLVPLTGATATATPTGETPQGAVDDDASTRWSTDVAQHPASSCRSTSAAGRPSAGSSSTPAPAPGTTPARGPCRPATTPPVGERWPAGPAPASSTTIDVPRTPRRDTCGWSRPGPPAPGGASPTCACTTEPRLRPDPAGGLRSAFQVAGMHAGGSALHDRVMGFAVPGRR